MKAIFSVWYTDEGIVLVYGILMKAIFSVWYTDEGYFVWYTDEGIVFALFQ